MSSEPEQWVKDLERAVRWAETPGIARQRIQRAFEERERKLREQSLADLGEALDHLLQDVEIEEALAAVGIGVYGPDATKFEKMFAAAMKCRERFAALKEAPDAG